MCRTPWHRRHVLRLAAGAALMPIVPARATPESVAVAMAALFGGREVRAERVKLDMPNLVENGNTVPLTVSLIDEPRTPGERVTSFHIFADGNPLPNVTHIRLGPRSGKARIATRIRLATSQTVIAVAECADGSLWSDSVELLVTLAACLE